MFRLPICYRYQMSLNRIWSLIVTSIVTSALAWASPILQVQGPLAFSSTIDPLQYLAISWTQTSSFTGVSVSATLRGTGLGNAYLMTAIGPGTTSASQVATAPIVFPDSPTDLALFSDLSLDPGTYYLLLTGNTSGQTSAWSDTSNPTITTGFGVTRQVGINYTDQVNPPAYAPDAVYIYYPYDNSGYALVNISGTAIPEPSFGALIGIALGMVVWRFRTHPLH
jgi:hypothetical protein